ncbi:hypothetical protein ABKV19_012168 [Rosa sericea]
MVNGFPAKSAVIAALLVVLLLMGGFPATCALIKDGGKGYDGTTKRTFSRREGCFGTGCQTMDLFHSKGNQMLGLRLRSLQPPPAPSKSQVHTFFVPPAPPPAQ